MQERWRMEMAAALAHALEATDAELHERASDTLLQLIVSYVPTCT